MVVKVKILFFVERKKKLLFFLPSFDRRIFRGAVSGLRQDLMMDKIRKKRKRKRKRKKTHLLMHQSTFSVVSVCVII